MAVKKEQKNNEPDEVQKYIHGEMNEPELDQFDELMLRNDAGFYEVADTENDLIDRYAAGELPNAEAARFEKRFEHLPSLRERVANARALQEQINHERRQPTRSAAVAEKNWLVGLFGLRSPVAGVAMSLALIVAVGLSTYFYVQMRAARNDLARAKGGELEQQVAEARRDIEQLRAQVESAGTDSAELVRSLDAVEQRNRELESQLSKSGQEKRDRTTEAPSIASLVLDGPERSGNRPKTTSIGSGTTKLAVNIDVPPTFKAVSVFTIELNGTPFAQPIASHAAAGGKRAVTVMVPRDKLRPGGNVLRVLEASGQEVTKYSFNVDEDQK